MSDQKQGESYSENDYTKPHVPPATAPVVNDAADASEAKATAPDGDSDHPGDHPTEQPVPDGDSYEPAAPDELETGKTPDEIVRREGLDGAGEQELDSLKPLTMPPPD